MNKTPEPAYHQATARTGHPPADHGQPQLDAEVLLAHALEQPRSHLRPGLKRSRLPNNSKLSAPATGALQRRTGRLPDRPTGILVTATGRHTGTLIPRPETETLVALALERIPEDRRADIADLGTGSGAIALAIAHERPGCRMLATDTSAAAIETATANAEQLGIRNIEFLCGDWCTPLQDRQFDVIASNPPYIKDTDPHLQQGDVRFEPHTALAAGPQGMDDLTKIAHCARQHLRTGGWLLMEHGYDQRDAATQLLTSCGFSQVADYQDDTGIDRVIAGRR